MGSKKGQNRHHAVVRDVDPISISGDQLLIGSGLNPGDRLIVAGWKGLVNGEAVNVLVSDGRMIESGSSTEAPEVVKPADGDRG